MNSGEILYNAIPDISEASMLLVGKGSQMVSAFNLCLSIMILAGSQLEEKSRIMMTKALAVCFAILITAIANATFNFPPNYGPPVPVVYIFSALAFWSLYVGFLKRK
tara:strand:+ start:146 stop:466 length:321 start_codon:yes stop_codon:yes gene_type:complete